MKISSAQYNEKKLLYDISRGDESAFVELFDHHKANIFATALRMIGDVQQAEEILQDTFLKVWLRRECLPGLDNFGGWLFTIAANLTYNVLKVKRRDRAKLFRLPDLYGGLALVTLLPSSVEDPILHKECVKMLHKAVNHLPEKQRQTYVMVKQWGMKREEVASTLRISPETVKWNLDQAVRKIRAFCRAHPE